MRGFASALLRGFAVVLGVVTLTFVLLRLAPELRNLGGNAAVLGSVRRFPDCGHLLLEDAPGEPRLVAYWVGEAVEAEAQTVASVGP